MYRQHHGKTGKRCYRYPGMNGRKRPFKKPASRGDLPFYQRRIGNEFQKYRFLNEYKKPVFRSVRTGRLQTETKFTDCPHRPDHSGIGIGIRWKTNSADYPLAILKIL